MNKKYDIKEKVVSMYTSPYTVVYMDNKEYWEDITCYDIRLGMYQVSTFGRIRNKLTGYILKQGYNNTGYLVVSLRCDGKYRDAAHFLVHRIMGFTFLSDFKLPYQNEINHIRGKNNGNHLNNIEWVSGEENQIHNKINFVLRGEDCHFSKLTTEVVESICEYLSRGLSYSQVLNLIGMEDTDNNRDLIGNIKRGISWKQVSDNYDFSNTKYSCTNYTLSQIHIICKMLEEGKSIKEIYEVIFTGQIYLGSRQNKDFYEFVRRIKHKDILLEISKDYDF